MSAASRFQLSAPTAAERYEPVEFSVAIDRPAVDNPFADVRCEGVFTAPSGKATAIQGFCDASDGALARLRFCPQATGRYEYRLTCADRGGEQAFTGTLLVTPSHRQGFVRIDPDHPRHFRYDDGGHPFLAGKTAWLIGSSPLWREFLDLCVLQNQNVVRLTVGGLDYGVGRYAARWWVERDGVPDYTRYELPQWQQIDRALRYGAERGLLFEICLFTGRQRTLGHGFPIPHPVMERFWDYTLARLAAFPNVLLWELFNEYVGHREYQTYMAEYLRARDPYAHLVTTSGLHPGDVPFPDADWNDLAVPHFCTGSDRDLHDFYRDWAMRLREHGKPVFVDETGRAIRNMKQFNYDGEHRRKQYWIWAMSGVYCNFHSKGGCYVDLTLEPGEEYWPHFSRFWQGTRWWALDPTEALVVARPPRTRAAYALAGDDEAIVYLYADENESTIAGDVTLALPPTTTWWAHWHDPKSGCNLDADQWEIGTEPGTFGVPEFRGDLALHLVRKLR